MATWAPKTYPTESADAEPRLIGCPAWPTTGKKGETPGGAPWSWCLASRGNLPACAACEWGKNAGAATAKCVQS